jgi:hypothetical protein
MTNLNSKSIIKEIEKLDASIIQYGTSNELNTLLSSTVAEPFINEIEAIVGHNDCDQDIRIENGMMILQHGNQTGYHTASHPHELDIQDEAIVTVLHKIYHKMIDNEHTVASSWLKRHYQ